MTKIVITAPRQKQLKFDSVFKHHSEDMLLDVDREIEKLCVNILCNAAEETKLSAPDFQIQSIDHFNGIGVPYGVKPTMLSRIKPIK